MIANILLQHLQQEHVMTCNSPWVTPRPRSVYKSDVNCCSWKSESKRPNDIECQGQWPPFSLLWRHNGRDSVSNHQPHEGLFNRLIQRISKKTSKVNVTGLCTRNSLGTGEFPAQMASNAKNVSIWWRHHVNTSRQNPKMHIWCRYGDYNSNPLHVIARTSRKWLILPSRSKSMTPIFNTSWEYHRTHVWYEFGDSSSNLRRVIVRTR